MDGRCRGSCNGLMYEERLRLSVVLQVITTGRCMPHQAMHLLVTKHLLYVPMYSAHTPVSLLTCPWNMQFPYDQCVFQHF